MLSCIVTILCYKVLSHLSICLSVHPFVAPFLLSVHSPQRIICTRKNKEEQQRTRQKIPLYDSSHLSATWLRQKVGGLGGGGDYRRRRRGPGGNHGLASPGESSDAPLITLYKKHFPNLHKSPGALSPNGLVMGPGGGRDKEPR